MTSPNNSNKDNSSASDETSNNTSDKQNGMLAGILERASKSGIGRKKSVPSPVASAVAKDMADIHSNPTKLRLAFLGGGSFGTAMANLAARNGCDTTLWVRNKRTVKAMAKTQTNKKYLPGYKLDDRLKYSHDLAASVKDKDIIFLAVPSSAFRDNQNDE